MKIVGHPVVETKIVIVNRAGVHHANAKGDHFRLLPPNEKPRPLRHSLSQAAKILFGQPLEFERRALMNLEVERVNFIDIRRDIVDYFEIDWRCAFSFSKFPAQILSRRFA